MDKFGIEHLSDAQITNKQITLPNKMTLFFSPNHLNRSQKSIWFFIEIIRVSSHPLELAGVMLVFHNTKKRFLCISFIFNKFIFGEQCPKEFRAGRRKGVRIRCD